MGDVTTAISGRARREERRRGRDRMAFVTNHEARGRDVGGLVRSVTGTQHFPAAGGHPVGGGFRTRGDLRTRGDFSAGNSPEERAIRRMLEASSQPMSRSPVVSPYASTCVQRNARKTGVWA